MKKQIESMMNELEVTLNQNEKETVKNSIASMFKEMGYAAISEEIRNNRRAKDNAMYGLKMYYRDIVGDRINPITEEVYTIPEDKKEKADHFYNTFETLIDKYLDNGTEAHRTYLQLMQNYTNEYFVMCQLTNQLDNIEDHDEWKEVYNQYQAQIKKTDEAKNNLDQFVFENM